MINSTIKIIASHFAMVREIPATRPNPNNPATSAKIKNTIAQNSNDDSITNLMNLPIYRCRIKNLAHKYRNHMTYPYIF